MRLGAERERVDHVGADLVLDAAVAVLTLDAGCHTEKLTRSWQLTFRVQKIGTSLSPNCSARIIALPDYPSNEVLNPRGRCLTLTRILEEVV